MSALPVTLPVRLPVNEVAVTTPEVTCIPPPVTFNPCLAVAIPAESTFLTSSYVNVPRTVKSPVYEPPPVTARVDPSYVKPDSAFSVVPLTAVITRLFETLVSVAEPVAP